MHFSDENLQLGHAVRQLHRVKLFGSAASQLLTALGRVYLA